MLPKFAGTAAWRRRALVCLLAFCLAALGSCGSGSKPEAGAVSLRIGGIYNLTGDQAPLGIPSTRGAQLAAEEVNAAGGIHGRSLELIVRDGASSTQTVAEVARELVADQQILALMGLSDTDMVLAAAPIAANAGRLFLTSGATSPLLVAQVPEYLFLACFTDNVQAAAAAEFSARQLNLSTAYILVDSGMDYSRLLGRYFGEAFVSFNGAVLEQGSFTHGGGDLPPALEALGRVDPSPALLYLATGPDEAPRVVNAYRQADFRQPVFGGDSFDSPTLYGSGAPDGPIYFTTHTYLGPDASSERVRTFVSSYRKVYNEEPTAFSALGYDTVHLLADALARAAQPDPGSLREALASTQNYQGVTGTISYQNGRREPTKSVTIIQVENGQRTLAADLIPTNVPSP